MDEDERVPFGRHTEEAWRELRRQLADHLAGTGPGEPLVLHVGKGVGDEDGAGAAPSVRLLARAGGTIRAEAASDAHLDGRWALGDAGAALLLRLGWEPPGRSARGAGGDGTAHWFLERDASRVDELAHLAVRTLREAYGCPHPSFLRIEGELEPTGPAAPSPRVERVAPARQAPPTMAEAAERDDVAYPGGAEELSALLAEALAGIDGVPVEADEDGDFPLQLGSSVLYLRVRDGEPLVLMVAEVVHGVADHEAARREVDLLNRETLLGTWALDGDSVLFRFAHTAVPFSPLQLRLVLGRIIPDLDERAGLLARRTGGLRFMERESDHDDVGLARPAAEHEAGDEAGDGAGDDEPAHPMLPVLGELLEVGDPGPREVAGLFDGDVVALTETIAELRAEPPAGLDVAEVIATLRQALAYAARQRADRAFGPRPKPPGRRRPSQQGALLSPRDAGDPGLDLDL